MTIEWEGCEQQQWIHEFIQGIPAFLQSHRPLFVGDIDDLAKPGYTCYVSKPEHTHDPLQRYQAYFQPYHLSDREPICGIQVDYRLNELDQAIYRVHPMNMSVVHPL